MIHKIGMQSFSLTILCRKFEKKKKQQKEKLQNWLNLFN